jgi:hypothetical protein
MNGATAEPEVKTIRLPNKTKHRTIGKSQNFFRSFMNPHNSFMNSYTGKPSDHFLYAASIGRRKIAVGADFFGN